MQPQFASAIYSGKLRHRRFLPRAHSFEYQVFMMYLDTRELEQVFSLSKFWSMKHWAPVQFKRSDFHGGQNQHEQLPLDEAVRKTVAQQTGLHLTGPVRMLVNLRYWGHNMNPLSTYYCFDEEGKRVLAILAEVNNTPWGERHAYVLTGEDFTRRQKVSFPKQFHVSPFNPLAMEYRWTSSTPSDRLAIHLENWCDGNKHMDATMTLVREEITKSSLQKILIRFPCMTVKIISAIYWQAFKLWLKRVPIFNHPVSTEPVTLSTSKENLL